MGDASDQSRTDLRAARAASASPAPATGDAPHTLDTRQVLRTLATDVNTGLSSQAAAERLDQYGRNVLAQAPRDRWWNRLARQFADLLIWVLIGAAIVSGALGEWIDACAILAIVVLNGLLGFFQEGRAEQAMAALRQLSSPHAKAIRDGRPQNVAAADLVPGDRIDLEPGDRVPADVRLTGSAALRVEEAPLTGESVPADKDHRVVLPESAALGDRINMAYMGTTVVAGTASAVVVATGMSTEIGQIAGLLERQAPEQTPLQRQLAHLGKVLVVVVFAIVAAMFLLLYARERDLAEAFLLSVSLAVAAVPEGLAAVVTVALALGLQRMARSNALIRRLPSVETLGAVTVICTDKTGTLTRNEMTVRQIDAGGRTYEITGSGYEPLGAFRVLEPDVTGAESAADGGLVDPREEPDLLIALQVGNWCNHAQVTRGPNGQGNWEVVGDPTEGALIVAAMKAGLETADRDKHVVHEIPFSSDRKAMSVVVQDDDGGLAIYTKGAPEVVLGKCTRELLGGEAHPLDDERRAEILQVAHDMGARALRVLGLAYRPTNTPHDLDETNLIFAGLVGMIDPPRDEVREAVARCNTAGISTVMITGDHPDTARAIARNLGILGDADRVMTGKELDRLSDTQLAAEVRHMPVYARVTAAHKLRIISAWRHRDEIAAMTGDGVNDAPAIKAADVGIAMGITGTDVTKEASDMVLLDDNFVSIVNAVQQGRTIYDNIRKFVHYLLATNAGEVLLMFSTALVGWPAPLVAIQILWINLVTDALPAMALGVEKPEPDVMQRPPRPHAQSVLTPRRGLRIVAHGILNAIASAAAFYVVWQGDEANLDAARTTAFGTLAYSQLVFSLACRSERYTMPELGLLSNRWLLGAIAVSGLLQVLAMTLPFAGPVFEVVPLTGAQWGAMLGLALVPVSIVEVTKIVRAAVGRR